MLKFEILDDENLQEVLDRFISAMLPHDNYNASMLSEILRNVFNFIHLDEMQMEYGVLFSILESIRAISSQGNLEWTPCLERDTLLHILEQKMPDSITKESLGVKAWLEYEGINSDLRIPTVKEEACQKLCERVLNLYDNCFELAVESDLIMNEMPALKSAFLTHCSTIGINNQKLIITQGMYVGRTKYVGCEGWLKYTELITCEVRSRLNTDLNGSIITLDSIEKSSKLLQDLKEFYVPIASYGIPELDRDTPMLRHRLVVVIGKENIGKTKFAIDKAVNVLMEGKRVVYMCGETPTASVFASILANYIWKKHGFIINGKWLSELDSCPEEVQIAINMAIAELTQSGLLTLTKAFNYATVYQELQGLYEKLQFDVCVIDHSCALIGSAGTGSLKDNVDALSKDVKNFKNDYPVCMLVTSHPSVNARNTDSKGKYTTDSPTKGSQNLSADADDCFYLRDNEQYRKQNKIMLENTKRRDAGRVEEYIILTKKFEVSAFVYDTTAQKIEVQTQEEADALDEKLNNMYTSSVGLDTDGGYIDE